MSIKNRTDVSRQRTSTVVEREGLNFHLGRWEDNEAISPGSSKSAAANVSTALPPVAINAAAVAWPFTCEVVEGLYGPPFQLGAEGTNSSRGSRGSWMFRLTPSQRAARP